MREKLLIDKDSFLIGHVGRFTAQKNHEFLIKIFNEYCKKNNRLPHLVLVGEGNEENKIRDLVKQLNIADNVHFLGVRSDINKILNSIDLFLFPSLYEGLGIVLIEAQAAGVACLVSNEVPKEADLDIDLIHRLDLSESEKIWAEKIEEIQKRNKAIEWDVIEEALIEKKYEINSTVKVVTDLYEHNK
nr:glycosyltransferase [Exiguobacterium sp. s69]